MLNVTIIKYIATDAEYTNAVAHQCTCGEFLKDIRREIEEFTKDKPVSKIDIFWHLDGYCEKKYGPCYWQVLTIDSLMLGAH